LKATASALASAIQTINFTTNGGGGSSSSVATVTSATYTVSAGGTATETITNVPYGTSKAAFLAALTKGEANQTWNDTNVHDPVVTGDTLVVTAQDTTTVVTYTITVDSIFPTVTKLGDGTTDVTIAQGGTATLVFSEAIKSTSRTGIENALTNGANRVITFTWNAQGDTLTINGNASGITTFANDVVVASISDLAGNISTNVLLVDSAIEAGQVIPSGGSVVLNPTTPQVVITNPSESVNVVVNSGTTGSTLNVDSFINNGTGVLPQITITANNAGNTVVSIPNGTTVTSSDSSWNGIINTPQVTSASFASETVGIALQMGISGSTLTFDKGVRILLSGQAGKRIKFSSDGINYTEITNICSADNQTVGNALPAGGDCKIDSGSDLVIWTRHFTTFVTFTVNSTGGGGGGGGVVLLPTTQKTTSQSKPTEIISQPVETYTDSQVIAIAKIISGTKLESNNILKVLADNTRYGQTGLNVKILQEVLKTYGFLSVSYNAAGYYDQETSSAVRLYKKQYVDSLLTDSQLRIIALKIAEIELKNNTILRFLVDNTGYDERSLRVKIMQEVLKIYGFFPEDISSTGYYDGYTTTAIEEYEMKYAETIITSNQLESLAKKIAEAKLKDNKILIDLMNSTAYGEKSFRVKLMQEVLKVYGFFPKSILSTGYYDGYTTAAIKKAKDFLALNKKYLDMLLMSN
jgi:hypothetical protein